MTAGRRLVVYRTRSLFRGERWRWKLVSANGNIVASSSEGYANRAYCIHQAMTMCPGAPLSIIDGRRRRPAAV